MPRRDDQLGSRARGGARRRKSDPRRVKDHQKRLVPQSQRAFHRLGGDAGRHHPGRHPHRAAQSVRQLHILRLLRFGGGRRIRHRHASGVRASPGLPRTHRRPRGRAGQQAQSRPSDPPAGCGASARPGRRREREEGSRRVRAGVPRIRGDGRAVRGGHAALPGAQGRLPGPVGQRHAGDRRRFRPDFTPCGRHPRNRGDFG